MSDTTVLIAISIIILGVLILAGLAIWLAVDRQRHQQASTGQAAPQSGSYPMGQPHPATSQPATSKHQAPTSQPAQHAGPAASQHAPTPQHTAPASKTGSKLPEPVNSGEYPSAALYDQTILPEPPKRRSRKTSQS
jgi:cytoskeletal protein RodZ